MTVPLFNLDPSVRQIYQDGIDTLILYLGRPCRFILDGAKTQCPNCRFDPQALRSAGVYNGTGPRSFTRPPCPVCKGTGYDPSTLEQGETRSFLIEWNVKPYTFVVPGNITRPNNIVRLKGYATDLPVLLQARYIIPDYQNALYTNQRYIKLDEPTLQGSIVAGRYCQVHLTRSE